MSLLRESESYALERVSLKSSVYSAEKPELHNARTRYS